MSMTRGESKAVRSASEDRLTQRVFRSGAVAVMLLGAVLLSACGGGARTGAAPNQGPPTVNPPPAPGGGGTAPSNNTGVDETVSVAWFRDNLWSGAAAGDGVLEPLCSGCHASGPGTGAFSPLRPDQVSPSSSFDVNIFRAAHDDFKGRVNFQDPTASRAVQKLVLEQHNCGPQQPGETRLQACIRVAGWDPNDPNYAPLPGSLVDLITKWRDFRSANGLVNFVMASGIAQLSSANPEQLYFDVSMHSQVPNSYIRFDVSPYDASNAAYLFENPTFVIATGGNNGPDGEALYVTRCQGCHGVRDNPDPGGVNTRPITGAIIQNQIANNGAMQNNVGDLQNDLASLNAIADYIMNGPQPPAPLVEATPTLLPANQQFQLAEIKIAINGVPPSVGQAYRNVDELINNTQQVLSPLSTIVPQANGWAQDQFSLELGLVSYPDPNNAGQMVTVDARVADPIFPAPPVDMNTVDLVANNGLRNFSQINATMSVLTGVDGQAVSAVRNQFNSLKQQLPGGNDLGSYVASHEVAILKLAVEYCDVFMGSATMRTNFFGTDPLNPFDRNLLFNGLIDNMVMSGPQQIALQPLKADLLADLNALFDGVTTDALGNPLVDANGNPAPIPGICVTNDCVNSAAAQRMAATAACMAVLSSAAVNVH